MTSPTPTESAEAKAREICDKVFFEFAADRAFMIATLLPLLSASEKLKSERQYETDLVATLTSERDELMERYVGNLPCGHLTRFLCAKGTMFEYCMACKEHALQIELNDIKNKMGMNSTERTIG